MNRKLGTAVFVLALGGGTALAQETGDTSPLEAVLTGDQQVPAVDSNATGQFSMLFDAGYDEASYTLTVSGLDTVITGAHLHCAAAGESGPVVLPLEVEQADGGTTAPDGQANTVTSTDVVTPEGEGCDVQINNLASLYAAILDGKIYANIHTDTNPDGEIRGQIFVTKEGVSEPETAAQQ